MKINTLQEQVACRSHDIKVGIVPNLGIRWS